MEISSTLVLAGLVLVLLWLFSVRNKKHHLLPPGPTALPLIGNLPQLDKHAPFKSLLKVKDEFGNDTDYLCLLLFEYSVYVSMD